MRLVVRAYPRSGSNFLSLNLTLWTDQQVGISHLTSKLRKDHKAVHIIRKPIDSIASMIWVNEQQGIGKQLNIESRINDYIDFYEYMLPDTYTVDKLIKEPAKVVKDILEHFNMEYTRHEIERPIDRMQEGFHATSRGTTRFDDIHKAVTAHQSEGMDRCNELYTKALALCA
jgi:hypothetical protein